MKWVSLSFDFFIWQVASGVSQDDQAESSRGEPTYLRLQGWSAECSARLDSPVASLVGLFSYPPLPASTPPSSHHILEDPSLWPLDLFAASHSPGDPVLCF